MGGLAKALTEDQELVRVMEKVCDRVWKDWYLSAPANWNEIYGDAFEWTPQEKMLMQQLKEKQLKEKNGG
jgi:hypothetical protein